MDTLKTINHSACYTQNKAFWVTFLFIYLAWATGPVLHIKLKHFPRAWRTLCIRCRLLLEHQQEDTDNMKMKHKEIYPRKSYSNNSFYAAFGQRKRKPMPMEQYVLNETKVTGNAPDSRRWSAVQEENISEGQKATRQLTGKQKKRPHSFCISYSGTHF